VPDHLRDLHRFADLLGLNLRVLSYGGEKNSRVSDKLRYGRWVMPGRDRVLEMPSRLDSE
jgi:hypothetical protein